MFGTVQNNVIRGKVCGVEVEITITTSADDACATPLVGGLNAPMVHEVCNVATFLVTACNNVLKRLEQDDAGVTIAVQQGTPSPEPSTGPKVLDIDAWKKAKKLTDDGEGD